MLIGLVSLFDMGKVTDYKGLVSDPLFTGEFVSNSSVKLWSIRSGGPPMFFYRVHQERESNEGRLTPLSGVYFLSYHLHSEHV